MFISLDLETTGFDPTQDKIIEFGAVKFNFDGQQESLKILINPGIPLPHIITHITGITDEDLKDAPDFAEKRNEIENFIGELPIIGHNINFDTTFLRANGIELKNTEYDTCSLASILLPNLPSYSLEILSKQLNLKHEEKHRALDDAIAAMELFLQLKEKFEELAPKLIEKIHTLIQRSNWPLGKFLTTLKPNHKKSEEEKIKTPPTTEIIELHHSLLDKEEKALIQILPPYENLINSLHEKGDTESYIAISHNFENIPLLDTPKSYISLKRLAEFEKKDSFKEYEIVSLIKYLIWREKTKTGLLSELKLFNQEKTTLSRIRIDENLVNPDEEFFFQQAKKQKNNQPTICSHRYLIEQKPLIKDLILIDFEKFFRSLYYESNLYLKLDILLGQLQALKDHALESQTLTTLENKSTILFGLIGILFNKVSKEDEFGITSFVQESDLNTAQWLDVKNATLSLIEASKELGEINNEETQGHLQNWKKTLSSLYTTFVTPDLEKNLIHFEIDNFQNIILKSTPTSLTENCAQILGNCENYKIVGENLDLNDDSVFIKQLSGLPSDLKLLNLTTPNPNLNIFNIEPYQDSAQENELLAHLTEFCKKRKGKTALILSSKQKIAHFTIVLSKNLAETDISIISAGTGSLGKLTEQFKDDPENSIIILTPANWENFNHTELIDTLIIHKIPFDHPNDIFTHALSRNFDKAFETFQIPRAITRLQGLITRLNFDPHNKKNVFILDSRLEQKTYGKKFQACLKNLGLVQNISINNI